MYIYSYKGVGVGAMHDFMSYCSVDYFQLLW